jgi:hypothetical protein
MDAESVSSLARALRPLRWPAAEQSMTSDGNIDAEYVKPYFEAFRLLVLTAASEGSGLRIDMS